MPVGAVDNALWDAEADVDGDDQDDGGALLQAGSGNASDAYEKLRERNPSRVRWADRRMFSDTFRRDLQHDADIIAGLLARFGRWEADKDSKLDALLRLLSDKHGDDKVLVFTEFR